jgi:hypothetical protein
LEGGGWRRFRRLGKVFQVFHGRHLKQVSSWPQIEAVRKTIANIGDYALRFGWHAAG